MTTTMPGTGTVTERTLAHALVGDADALHRLIDIDLAFLDRHRAVPALADQRRRLGESIPEAWLERSRGAAARWLAFEATRAEVAQTFADADIAWVPIKGCDVADRFYASPESRPTSDLDVLVHTTDLGPARLRLEACGWHGVAADPRTDRYLREEGYAWPATREKRPLLEVHFRLWGLAPAELGDRVLNDAVRHQGESFARPSPPDAYLLAAVHQLLTPVPRPILGLLDLEQIARHGRPGLAQAVVARARSFDLQLPVWLAASAANALWESPIHQRIAADLEGDLRRAERAVARRFGPSASLRSVVLARLLAGRRSRAGWRTVRRRIWSHAGVVAAETPSAWWWPRRRLVHVARQLLGLATR